MLQTFVLSSPFTPAGFLTEGPSQRPKIGASKSDPRSRRLFYRAPKWGLVYVEILYIYIYIYMYVCMHACMQVCMYMYDTCMSVIPHSKNNYNDNENSEKNDKLM